MYLGHVDIMHAQRLGIMPKMTYACLAFCVSGERAHGLFKDHARAGNALAPAQEASMTDALAQFFTTMTQGMLRITISAFSGRQAS